MKLSTSPLFGLSILAGAALLTPQSAHAYLATGRTVSGSSLATQLFLTTGTPAPVNTRVWFVADRNGDGVPTSPAPGAVLGADDVLIYEDVVDGTILGAQAGRYQRAGISADDSLKTATIYFYLWNFTTPTTEVPVGQFVPKAGDTFGLFRIGVVAPPQIGNAAWDVSAPVLANQHTVGGPKPNQAPVLGELPAREIAELATLTFTAFATDADAGQTLTFSLGAGAPGGATVNPATGAFSWTPGETDGPGSYPVTVRVSDNGTPALTAEKSFVITVLEVNQAPLLGLIAAQTVTAGSPLSVPLLATDADLPAQALTFALVNPPAGAVISGTSFQWTPTAAQVGTNVIEVQVTDSGVPALKASRSFEVRVESAGVSAPVAQLTGDGQLKLRFTTRSGRSYQAQRKGALDAADWTMLGSPVAGTGSPLELSVESATAAGFFRVLEQ